MMIPMGFYLDGNYRVYLDLSSHIFTGIFPSVTIAVGGQWQDLLLEPQHYKSMVYVDTTKKTYNSMCLAYLRFCLYFGGPSKTIIAYTAFVSRTLRPTSMFCYFNFVRLLHLESGFDNPLANNFVLNIGKRAILRQHSSPSKQNCPYYHPCLWLFTSSWIYLEVLTAL